MLQFWGCKLGLILRLNATEVDVPSLVLSELQGYEMFEEYKRIK